MRLKDNTNPFIHVNPPYQLMVVPKDRFLQWITDSVNG